MCAKEKKSGEGATVGLNQKKAAGGAVIHKKMKDVRAVENVKARGAVVRKEREKGWLVARTFAKRMMDDGWRGGAVIRKNMKKSG